MTSYETSNSFHFLCLENLVTELNDLNIHGENPASCSQREILLKCLTRHLCAQSQWLVCLKRRQHILLGCLNLNDEYVTVEAFLIQLS